jgi:hypothetical protein
MKNEDLPAHPCDVFIDKGGPLGFHKPLGLTKLEYAAIMAMKGMLSNGDIYEKHSVIAYDSIAYAKELLKQLEEK